MKRTEVKNPCKMTCAYIGSITNQVKEELYDFFQYANMLSYKVTLYYKNTFEYSI